MKKSKDYYGLHIEKQVNYVITGLVYVNSATVVQNDISVLLTFGKLDVFLVFAFKYHDHKSPSLLENLAFEQ